MDIRPIRNDGDLTDALREIERLWGSRDGTPDGDKLEVLITLADAYEQSRWPVSACSPLDILRYAIRDMGHSQDELGRLLGSRSRASEVLCGKRRLTVGMIHKISQAWGLPPALLVQPYAAGDEPASASAA